MSGSSSDGSRPELNVVERGAYSDAGEGPARDTTGYYKATPAGVEREPFGPPSVAPRRPGAPTLARDKLARTGPPTEGSGPGGIEGWHVVLVLCTVPLGLGLLFAAWLMAGGDLELVPPPPEVVEDGPKEIDGIPVRRGLQR